MKFLTRGLFARFGITPRERRLLLRLETGPVPASERADWSDGLPAIAERGWAVADADGAWTLTPEGEQILGRLERNVRMLRLTRLPHPRRPL